MHILIIAGESSGDSHGAQVVQELKRRHPSCRVSAIGGYKMQKAGADIIFDCAKIAVMGFVEVIKHYSDLKLAWRTAKNILTNDRPDLVMLIDYPGFNLRFAKLCHQQNTPVLYYISPQIWAWKKKRISKIKKYVDHMAVILPFETAIYQQAGVPVTYVGNPILDNLDICPSPKQAKHHFGFETDDSIIGLLPGSRTNEIKLLLPIMLETAALIAKQRPQTKFIIPIANTLDPELVRVYCEQSSLPLTLVEHQSHKAIQACDFVLTSSGTATLEIALIGIPMVIIYKMNPITFWLAKHLVKIKHIGLCNIIASERIVPELIQSQAQAAAISQQVDHILNDAGQYQQIVDKLSKLRQQLQIKDHTAKQVTLLIEKLANPTVPAL